MKGLIKISEKYNQFSNVYKIAISIAFSSYQYFIIQLGRESTATVKYILL